MNIFACRALTSTYFVRPVPIFTQEKVEEQASKVEATKRMTEVSFCLPLSTLSSYQASAELEKWQYEKNNRDVSVKEKKLVDTTIVTTFKNTHPRVELAA